MLAVQRQFVDIDTHKQYRLTNLLRTIQHDVPPQPHRSYRHVSADSDSDVDDVIFLTSLDQSPAGISYSDDDDDDDDDDCANWEQKYDAAGSATSYDGDRSERASSAKLPLPGIKREPRETVKREADMVVAISSSDDDEMASFAATFDSRPDTAAAAAAAGQSGEKLRRDSLHTDSESSSECSDDSDDELTAAAWQRLHGNPATCNLKVEDVDDVADFISEFVNVPAAQPAATTGNISSCCSCCSYCCY